MNYERFIWREEDIEILQPEEVMTPEESLDNTE